jgi:hypothetical protein
LVCVSLIAIVCVSLIVIACAAPLPEGESGLVAMVPFTNEEQGIRGNTLLDNSAERMILNQEAFPGTREELAAIAKEQTELVQIPRSTGAYKGAYLTWDLYRFTTKIVGEGSTIFHVDMALAQGTGDDKQYLVTLVALPMDYAANPAKYHTVFEHALYAFEPLE